MGKNWQIWALILDFYEDFLAFDDAFGQSRIAKATINLNKSLDF